MTRPAAKSTKKPVKTLATPKAPAKRSNPVDTAPASRFAPRVRISHRTFGPGIVQSVDGDKLQIKFEKVGVKWIVDSYVTRV